MAFSQFVDPTTPYRVANLMVDVLELYRIANADDGQAFDEHWSDMTDAARDPHEGVEPRLLPRIEDRHGSGGRPLDYRPNPSRHYPRTWRVLTSAIPMARDRFVAFLMGPSSTEVTVNDTPGWRGPEDSLSEHREAVSRQHCVTFDGLWEKELIQELADQVGKAPFSALHHESLGVDHSLRFAPLQAMFHILISDTRLRQLLAGLCQLRTTALSKFSGRIYRMIPWRDADGWHNDVHKTDHRLIALSLYLESPTPKGGELLIRRAGFRRCLHREPPHSLGELTVFRVAHDFEHKVARVHRGARTNVAGWYLAAAHYPYREQWLDRLYFTRPSQDETFARRWLSRS